MDELDIPNKIDLTKYDLLDKEIVEHIERNGIIIYERSKSNESF